MANGNAVFSRALWYVYLQNEQQKKSQAENTQMSNEGYPEMLARKSFFLVYLRVKVAPTIFHIYLFFQTHLKFTENHYWVSFPNELFDLSLILSTKSVCLCLPAQLLILLAILDADILPVHNQNCYLKLCVRTFFLHSINILEILPNKMPVDGISEVE